MLRFLVPLTFVLSSATSLRGSSLHQHQHRLHQNTQVASESQVKFALENKYDDTGPGAKKREYAYNTYKNLDDALIAYLDDPDTKLPDHEREKAIRKLLQSQYHSGTGTGKLLHKNSNFKVLEKPQFRPLNYEVLPYNFPVGNLFRPGDVQVVLPVPKGLAANEALATYQTVKKPEPFRFQKIQSVKGSPLSLAHYTRDEREKVTHDQFDSFPKYTFSYGVHDKITGDSKAAQETRDGGNVRGFYSFIDADGKTRTVHYTADDSHGFRANVKKSH